MNIFILFIRYCYSFIKPRPKFYHRVKKNGINTTESRNQQIIVSLTSFPARIKIVSYTVETILSQSFQPDKVILWLAKEQFPKREKDLPKRLLNLRRYGLSICWCDDIRSFKKLIPSLVKFPDDIIVTADDDVYYPPYWLERLYTSYQKDKKAIHCNRGNILQVDEKGFPLPYNSWGLFFPDKSVRGFNVLQTGVGGVLYPPHSLYKDVIATDKFMKLSKDADDLWFWAMAILAGRPIKIIDNNQNNFDPIFMVSYHTLWSSNQQGHNDLVISNLFKYYPQLATLLRGTYL